MAIKHPPTERGPAMQMRRELWTDVRRTILDYVIDQAARTSTGSASMGSPA